MNHPHALLIENCAMAIDELKSEGWMTPEQQEKAVTIVALLHYLAESVREQA